MIRPNKRGLGILDVCQIHCRRGRDGVDVREASEGVLRIRANTEPKPKRDSIRTEGQADVVDPTEIIFHSILGIDAMKKLPGEGSKRPWPPLIRLEKIARKEIG